MFVEVELLYASRRYWACTLICDTLVMSAAFDMALISLL